MIYWLEIIQLKMKSEKTCGNAFNTDWSRLPGVTRHTHILTGTTSGHSYVPWAEMLTVAAVIPGKSLSRPTFLFNSVETWNLAVVLALHTVSQLTENNRKQQRQNWKKNPLDLINWKGFVWLCLLVISTSALARGARLGEEKALKLPVSTLVTRFPL